MRRLFAIVTVIVFTFTFSSCKKHDTALLKGIGYENINEKENILSYIITSDDNKVFKSSSKSIAEAYEDISSCLQYELFLGQNELLILSNQLKSETISHIVNEYFTNDKRKNGEFLYMTDMDMEELFNIASPMEITQLTGCDSSLVFACTLHDFVAGMNSNSHCAILPFITLNDNGNIEISSMALYKDYRIVDYFSGEELIGLGILLNSKNQSLFEVEYLGDSYYIKIEKSKTSYKTDNEKDAPECHIKLKFECRIDGSNSLVLENTDIERPCREYIINSIFSALKKLEKNNCDLLCISGDKSLSDFKYIIELSLKINYASEIMKYENFK